MFKALADVFFILKIPYDSKEAAELLIKKYLKQYISVQLKLQWKWQKKRARILLMKVLRLSEGKFQFDLWETLNHLELWNWEGLREKIKKYGVRNSLTTACMPTASTGIILSNTETFQIQTSNIYKRQTLSGEFLLVNRSFS